VPAAPTMAAAEAEAAEAAAAPPVAEVELTAEQEDLLASFLSDVTQVFFKFAAAIFPMAFYLASGTTKAST
jgi:hypothetical protein